jgi:VIT1/CCC1 family predicted Fe2+/Mn2+ transporter
MDGSVSTLAPLFAAAALTGRAHAAFFVGLAASLGAGISMGLAEALSDDGSVTGRGNPWARGAVTGGGTVLGGMFHTLPFLITHLRTALSLAYAVVVLELIAIAYIRYRYMASPLGRTIVQVILGGGLVFAIGLWLGRLGAGA